MAKKPTRSKSTRSKAASPYAPRISRLREALVGAGIDHLLVTNPLDVGYLTGFLGGESYLLVGPGRPVVISDFRYQEELEPVRPIADIYIRSKGMHESVADVFRERRPDRCGVQSEHLSVAELVSLSALVGPDRVTPVAGLIGPMRVVKDEHEVALMQTAIQIQEAALKATLKTLKPGQTELEIAARLEAEMKTRGSSKCWFESIIAAGPTGSLPHYRPGKNKTAKGKSLLIDWGATHEGYGGDMTRTFAFGKWPAKIKEIYQIVLEAQQTAAAALAPGKSTHEVDGIARDIITRAGYGPQFGHGLGHGLGLSKEPPYLNRLYPDMTLVAGHVVTVEPGIYLPGVGGVRIEDLYVVTEKGARNLCSLPKDLKWATL